MFYLHVFLGFCVYAKYLWPTEEARRWCECFLQLVLQVVVSYLMRMLETQLGFSVRAAGFLKHLAISLAPSSPITKLGQSLLVFFYLSLICRFFFFVYSGYDHLIWCIVYHYLPFCRLSLHLIISFAVQKLLCTILFCFLLPAVLRSFSPSSCSFQLCNYFL